LSRCHRDDLAITDDLVLRIKAWVSPLILLDIRQYPFRRECHTPFSIYLESRRDQDPRARIRLQELNGSGPQGRECGFDPQPARVRASFIDDHVVGFIDDHVAGASKPRVADR
jgi:hypothetical protein